MNEKLKRCPFCSSESISVYHRVKDHKESYVVKCENCGGRTAYWRRRTFAIEHWNRRGSND